MVLQRKKVRKMLAQVIFELFWTKNALAVGIFLSCKFNRNVMLKMRVVMSVKSLSMEIMMERLMTVGRYVTSLRNNKP